MEDLHGPRRRTWEYQRRAGCRETGIECWSCHDPHNTASVDDYFLRGNLKGGGTAYICLKSHIK